MFSSLKKSGINIIVISCFNGMVTVWVVMAGKGNPLFAKGKPRPSGAGRKKGTPNKTTIAVKDALQQAFDKLGGIKALVAFAEKEPAEFYRLWVKMLPRDIKADITTDGQPISTITSDQAVKMIRDFHTKSEITGAPV